MHRNIIISSAGKRVELLKEFKSSLKDIQGKVIAVDLNPFMSPACHMADRALEVPRVTDVDFINHLLHACKDNEVKLIIPTIDTELLPLAKNRKKFLKEGVEIMVSDESFISCCRDKRKTIKLFESLGIKNPEPRDKYHPVFPMFAKPYDGSLSSNIHVIYTEEDLTTEIFNNPKLLFMEVIDKKEYKEFTVDMYYGKDNYVKSIVPRERIEIRSGEVNKGATRKNYIVNYLKDRMNYMPGVRGCICIQLFYRESDNDIIGIEINPRFGGGYPLSFHAGANFPEMMIKEYILEQSLDYNDNWVNDTIMLRYDSQVIVKGE